MLAAVNQDGRDESWPRWIKQLFQSLSGDPSQFTPEERHLSQLSHVAASLSILILWWAFFHLVLGMSMARFQEWQTCENNLSPANATQISLSQQQDQINGMIDALGTTATPSQKMRIRQQTAEIIRILDSACQRRLYFASHRVAIGTIGTAAATIMTLTLGLSAYKGIQQTNRLTLNLAGTALIALTTAVSVSALFSDSSNLLKTVNLYFSSRYLLNTIATDLVNPKSLLATPVELEAWMKAKDQAIHTLLMFHLNVNETLMDQTLTKYLPNTSSAPLPAAPAPQPAAAAQP
jgi:hypothetical protein